MQYAAAAATVIGTGIQVASMIKQGNAQADAANFNADQAAKNAKLSIAQAAEDERSFRVIARKHIGDVRSAYGASGVTNEGSAQDVLEESAANAELDALKIRHGGLVKAAGFQTDATLSNMRSQYSREGGYWGGAAALLGGSAKVFNNFYSGGSGAQNSDL